jgi:chromosome segregation ATPase
VFGNRRIRELKRDLASKEYALVGFRESLRGMSVQAEARRIEIEQLREELAKARHERDDLRVRLEAVG